MNAYILSLSDETAVLEQVGGKGLSLSKLARAGLPVPDGFHVTTAAYRRFVEENHLRDEIMHALKECGRISRPRWRVPRARLPRVLPGAACRMNCV